MRSGIEVAAGWVWGLGFVVACSSNTTVEGGGPAAPDAHAGAAGSSLSGGSAGSGSGGLRGGTGGAPLGGTAAAGAGGGLGPGLGEPGQICGEPSDCKDGYCVEGVCCDAACDDPCERCSAAGACAPREAGTDCGDFVTCNASGACFEGTPGRIACGENAAEAPLVCSNGQRCCASTPDREALGCGATCTAAPDWLGFDAACDEHADCGGSARCWVELGGPMTVTRCSNSGYTFRDESGYLHGELCATPLGSSPCPEGESCVGSPLLPDPRYRLCVAPGAGCLVGGSDIAAGGNCVAAFLSDGIVPGGCNVNHVSTDGSSVSNTNDDCRDDGTWRGVEGAGNHAPGTPLRDTWKVSCGSGSLIIEQVDCG